VPEIDLPAGMVATIRRHQKLRLQDEQDSRFYLEAELTDGILTFEVVSVVGAERGQFFGFEFFDAMMRYFGRRVKQILAQWVKGGSLRTNLDLFNRATGVHGMTKEAAVFETHTGRWAKDWGYFAIDDLQTFPDPGAGNFTQVLVWLKKPKTRRTRKKTVTH
jgi:hypothetical protein